jgi:hypothetical protein
MGNSEVSRNRRDLVGEEFPIVEEITLAFTRAASRILAVGRVADHSPLPIFRKMNACDQKQMGASSGSGISGAFRVGTIVIAAVLVHVGVRDVGFFQAKGSDE